MKKPAKSMKRWKQKGDKGSNRTCIRRLDKAVLYTIERSIDSKKLCTDSILPLQIKPVQKQTRAGQRTRFKAVVVIGDSNGHVGLGIKTSKEVATAIRAAIIIAKLAVVPIRRGYWGSNLGEPHSIPVKESGKCGSVTVRVSRNSNQKQ